MTTNDWCQALGIERPKLEAVVGHSEANTFALLLVALLERGAPMTLVEVAARFEQAGVADRDRALRSLQRCKPGRRPVYREGDQYHLDPYDHDLELWVFTLGLRPPKVRPPEPPRVEEELPPLPGPETALTGEELDEAWSDASLHNWSFQRLTVAVLDTRGGTASPADVVAEVSGRTRYHRLDDSSEKFLRRNSAVEVLEDGRWAIAPGADGTVSQVREAVREMIVRTRKYAPRRSPEDSERAIRRWEAERTARGAELAKLSRVLIVAYPTDRPQAAALLDVGERAITTFVGEELAGLPGRVEGYDVVGAVDVRALLRALGIEPGARRLAELGPPQKTITLNRRGRTLKITTELLVQGSCGISKPFGDPAKLDAYLAKGETTKLRRRLEADVKSLHALYEYGRLHGTVRLRWGFLDELIPVPWVHRDELKLYDLKKTALARQAPLEVVVGSAPSWGDPWSRARLAFAVRDVDGWRTWLVDEHRQLIDEDEIQCARLIGT